MQSTPDERQRAPGERSGTRSGEESTQFWGFTLNGSTSLEAVATFYGLKAPGLEAGMTLGDYIAKICYGRPRAGYRLALNGVELVVQSLEEGLVERVGLRFLPLGLRHPRRYRLYSKLQAQRSLPWRSSRLMSDAPHG